MARFSTHVPLRQRLLVPLALLTVVAFTVLPILPASALGNAVDLGVNDPIETASFMMLSQAELHTVPSVGPYSL